MRRRWERASRPSNTRRYLELVLLAVVLIFIGQTLMVVFGGESWHGGIGFSIAVAVIVAGGIEFGQRAPLRGDNRRDPD